MAENTAPQLRIAIDDTPNIPSSTHIASPMPGKVTKMKPHKPSLASVPDDETICPEDDEPSPLQTPSKQRGPIKRCDTPAVLNLSQKTRESD
ncbi:hypothetical protein BSKO_00058 [Bryopsis sp. KO-2023]|nr:hypothetical protein BSKO_00058 [Bryopsis sp. KO-2023]